MRIPTIVKVLGVGAAGILLAQAMKPHRGRRGIAAGGSSHAIVDMRSKAVPNKDAAPHVRERDNVPYAVVLHQMGFSRGNDPSKYLGVTAHYIVLPDGMIYQLYGHQTRLPAADGFNHGSISIEFAGNLPSKAGSTNPDHYWFPPGKKGDPAYMNQLTPAQASAGRWLLKWLRAQGFTHVFGHIQSEGGKGIDPGPDVWGAVGEYAVRQLAMNDGGQGFALPGGAPIKAAWRDAYAQRWAKVA